jgi:hypothetical protein
MVLPSSTSRVRRTPLVETVETKRRLVPASGVDDLPSCFSITMIRVTIDCASDRCFAMSSSEIVVSPVVWLIPHTSLITWLPDTTCTVKPEKMLSASPDA